METRLATATDAPAMAELHAQCFGDAHWSERQITDSLLLETSQAWMVYENDEAQGFMLCQWVGREAEILTFCVAPRSQRKGLGRHLLRTMLTSIKDKATQRIFLEVAIDNYAARALYQKCGFRMIGQREEYYHRGDERIDAILLALEL